MSGGQVRKSGRRVNSIIGCPVTHQVRLLHKPFLVAACPRWEIGTFGSRTAVWKPSNRPLYYQTPMGRGAAMGHFKNKQRNT